LQESLITQFIQSKNGKIILALLTSLFLLGTFILTRDTSKIITKGEFEQILNSKEVKKIFIKSPYIYLKTKEKLYKIPKESINLKELSYSYPIEIKDKEVDNLIYYILLLLGVGGVFLIYLKTKESQIQDRAFELENTQNPQEFDIKPIHSNITFSDVAGMESVKEELEEIIDFLSNPKEYKRLDIRLPKGVLLVGPPGVGKTLIAKALAGEANVPFFYQSGANIVEIYVGMGAKKIHRLFQSAKKMAPSIIFIDEIDSVGKARGSLGNEEREATLNQLLTEMDGFDSNSGVIVIGATNRLDVLDEALLRPGRFDRRVFISLPDIKEREEILKLYLKKKPNRVNIPKIANQTVGFSASALSTLVNEAALFALKAKKELLEDNDFEAVKDKVISGKRKVISLSEQERKIQAVYQSGKILIATWFGIPYEKIGLVTTRLQEIDREIVSKSEMLNRVKFYLAGSIATWEVFDQKFSNASEDIQKAILEAQAIVKEYAMGEFVIANEAEVEIILKEAREETKKILKRLSKARVKIEKYLLKHENIRPEDAKEILGEIF
jgi:ATP-dependent metalloprotease FtsH